MNEVERLRRRSLDCDGGVEREGVGGPGRGLAEDWLRTLKVGTCTEQCGSTCVVLEGAWTADRCW